MLLYYLIVLVVHIISCTTAYDTPSGPQYHIQTDEGPERYFRYQTLSGQYRKEKRLEDGTVVGSYAWIDDDGILRQRDYIADNAGYRILKTKNIFVGRNVPVGEAVKSAKKYPANAGTLVRHNAASAPVESSYKESVASRRPVVTVPYSTSAPYTPSVISTTPAPPAYVEIYSNGLGPSTPVSLISTTDRPYVEITPHSLASSTATANIAGTTLSPNTAYYSSSTVAPPERSYYSSTPRPFRRTTPQKELQYFAATPDPPSELQYDVSPISGNSIEYNPYVSPSDNNYVFQNGPTYPIDKNGHTYRGQIQRRRIGNGYDKQNQDYDGVSVTNDGFRYYIPRAYHEEESDGVKKSGSFGYIDPFGIRRVIYYNAEPGSGFQHRKNNRYVGFEATPYDPRPY